MTRVCFVGDPDVTLQYELLSRETSREALSTYDLERPFENSIAVRTVSIGTAISLCNDLQWYVVRFVDEVLIQEPSVSEDEWLSRKLGEALRNGDLEPEETGEFLKIYGVEYVDPPRPDGEPGAGEDVETDAGAQEDASTTGDPGRLVEPLYARRTDGEVPEYDLRDVDETVVVRLTEAEYAP